MPTLALRSPRTASIDALRADRAPLSVQAASVVGFALLTGLLAQFEIQLYLWEVPITLQTVAVYGAGLVLGSRNGLLAMALYLALGLFLPLYAGGAAGAEYLVGASGGYLVGMALAAAVIGALSRRMNTLAGSALSVLGGSAVLFACGVTWLHFAADHASWWQSIESGWLRFVVWDLTKVAFVSAVYSGLRRLTA
ncbi:MAG TPA: biotin transporter BioY [Rubricoccaceae bacterium]|nr:biotin transporter BioY [Rubricoccaceae bacterium]